METVANFSWIGEKSNGHSVRNPDSVAKSFGVVAENSDIGAKSSDLEVKGSCTAV